MTVVRYSRLLVLVFAGVNFLSESWVRGHVPLLDESDFPMGMHHSDFFEVKKINSKSIKPTKILGSFRLPKAVVPIHYSLEIRPILTQRDKLSFEQQFTCPGTVVIRCNIMDSTHSITLHSKKVTIDSTKTTVVNANNVTDTVVVTGFNVDEERSFHTIFVDRDLVQGQEYLVTIHFVAPISDPAVTQSGLYKTLYWGSDGTLKIGAVTQFEKDDASRAFPCFDEPQMKAEFTLKIGRLENWTSFSNARLIGPPTPIDDLEGWVWDSYEKSVKMSVYLLAYAILTDYVSEETPAGLYRLPIKTWIPKVLMTNVSGKSSADYSARILTHFEDLFQTPIYYSKMENLAVENMDLLAMEHPGLVTYRPNLLVWSSDKDTQWDLFNQAAIIAHEYVHQWFGNLVTCKWWNDFWLNEAFARYFQFVGCDLVAPGFKAKERIVIDVTQWAMDYDESPETVSIRNEETEKVTYQPFQIEYEKGAAIVQMMKSILTEKTFINGLQRYFKAHQFQNVGPEDLFRAFTDQAKEDKTLPKYPISQIMKPWLTKTGFPILQVSKACDSRVYISQQRFIMHPAASDKLEPGLWFVPVFYITKSNPNFDANNAQPNFWMDKETLTAYLPLNNTDEWIIVNPQGGGYYRVIYDRALTTLIVKQLHENHLVFDAGTRSMLLDNYIRSARARYITLDHALMVTSYLYKEDSIVVWTTVFNNYRRVYQKLTDTPLFEPFKKYLLRHLRPASLRLGLYLPPGAPPTDILLHSMFLDWLCMMEDELCHQLVTDYMEKWMADPSINPIPIDVQAVVYCSAMAVDTEKFKPFILSQLRIATYYRQRNMLLRSLTCSKDKEYLQTLVENTLNPDYPEINMQTYGSFILLHVVRSQLGQNFVWQFIQDKHQEISERLGALTIAQVVEAVAPYMSNRGSRNLSHEFMLFIQNYLKTNAGNIDSRVQEVMQKSAQSIVENSLWMDFFYDDLNGFMEEMLNHA